MQSVNYADWMCRGMERTVLIDLASIPKEIDTVVRAGYNLRNQHILAGDVLCPECFGTGNVLFAFYRKCGGCDGTGLG